MMSGPLAVIAPGWSAPDSVVAFTTTRRGGFSSAHFGSLNLAEHVGDEAVLVRKNRDLLVSQTNLPGQPLWLNQTHSTRILDLQHQLPLTPQELQHEQPQLAQDADGAVTSLRGLVCCVMTADCMPLFVCTRLGTKVGVIHAGWRGMADGIIEQAVAQLDESPEQIMAWAGPTISGSNFEIGNEVREQLGGSDRSYSESPNQGKCFADLYRLAGERLKLLGIHSYGYEEICTYADKLRFFSHRRDQSTGRMASIIYRK